MVPSKNGNIKNNIKNGNIDNKIENGNIEKVARNLVVKIHQIWLLETFEKYLNFGCF